MNKYLIIPFLFILTACGRQNVNDIIAPVVFLEKNDLTISEESIDCEFIPLETTLDNLIGGINQVEVVDSFIFILDNIYGKKMLVFNERGKFIAQIGKYGGGPGEYVLPAKFFINKSEQKIIIADGRRNRFLYYNLNDYQYISSKEIPFNFSDLTFTDNGKIVWFMYTGATLPNTRAKYHVKITTGDFQDIAGLYPIDFVSSTIQVMGGPIYEYDNRIFVHHAYFPTVYEVTSSNTLKPVYELSSPPHRFPTVDYLKGLEEKEDAEYWKTLSVDNYISAYNLQETKDYICITYFIKNKAHIGFYNKNTKASCKFYFPDFSQAAQINGLGGVYGTYKDRFIARVFPEVLKHNHINRDNLREIAKQVKEDDNPILCFFKFKQ